MTRPEARDIPIVYASSAMNTFNSKVGSHCALLFFGVPRLFRSAAFPSIQRYILHPNKECNVFVHSFNISTLTVIRNDEHVASLFPADLNLLVHNDQERIQLESMETFYSKHNISFFRQHHHRGWGESFGSTENMVKAWHSIQGVWNIMKQYQLKHKIRYKRVGLFRCDVMYTHTISIQNPTERAVIPKDFVWYLKKKQDTRLVNDRGMYGDYQYAEIWATKRFSFASTYVKRHSNESALSGVENTAQGIHSESFLYELLEYFRVPYEEKNMCFFRLRATGVVLHEDCIIPGLKHMPQNAGYRALEGFNRELVSRLKCKGKSSKSPIIPCTKHKMPSDNEVFFSRAWDALHRTIF